MAEREKTGGRKKGTLNRRTLARQSMLLSILEQHNYDPIEALVVEANDPMTHPVTRRKIHLALVPYIYPRIKDMEAPKDDILAHRLNELVARTNELAQ